MGEDSWPFRFYGAEPADWFEGLQDYELHFAHPPGPEERLAIARAFEDVVAECPAIDAEDIWPREGWWWSGEWALCPLRRATSTDEAREFDAGLVAAFLAVHDVSALVEVVCLTVRAASDDDEWTQASLAEQREPAPGPRWEDGVNYALPVFGRRRNRLAERPDVDPIFEEERRRARESLSQAGFSQPNGAPELTLDTLPEDAEVRWLARWDHDRKVYPVRIVDEDAEAVTVATRDGYCWRVPRTSLQPHPLRFSPGDRVVAQWADTEWYAGIVTAVDGARAQITFDDGSSEWIPFAGIIDESAHD
jgi:hypothetical protein